MEPAFSIPSDDEALERGIRDMLEQMEALRAQMLRDQEAIDQLKRETTELKAECAALGAETRAILATLHPVA